MSLEEYKKKRDLNKSHEPKGKVGISKLARPIYLIHLHDSSHLHRDLRLEMDGVLKSWAIPKDPLLTLEGKRLLAVQVEDHPLSYSTFEGLIPESQYGAGTVKIWDKGTFETLEKTDKKIIINIKGKKLKGTYILIKFKPPNNWLFFKKKE